MYCYKLVTSLLPLHYSELFNMGRGSRSSDFWAIFGQMGATTMKNSISVTYYFTVTTVTNCNNIYIKCNTNKGLSNVTVSEILIKNVVFVTNCNKTVTNCYKALLQKCNSANPYQYSVSKFCNSLTTFFLGC